MRNHSDIIAAPATPTGSSGIAVIRVSGLQLDHLIQSLCGKPLKPRVAEYVNFRNEKHEIIDQGIAIYFKAPHSFTGEDVLEIQGHGNPILIDELMRTVIAFGARFANAGEFSERAFLNNKLDLTQAEAIADLIQAKSLRSAQSALRSLQGAFSKKIHEALNHLIELRKYVEAAIDFSEEEIEFLELNHQQIRVQQLKDFIETILKQAEQGSLLQEGIRCVLSGAPNVGKSSLLNALSGYDRAIVTPIAGTTRDTLNETITLDGIPFFITDTAGLRESEDIVEQAGITRAKAAIEDADLILFLFSADEEVELHLKKIREDILFQNKKIIFIQNKIDLYNKAPQIKNISDEEILVLISAKCHLGLDLLKKVILKFSGWHSDEHTVFSARRRHLIALEKTKQHLESALLLIQLSELDRFAEELRQAQIQLGDITGEFSSEDLLTEIFSSFCIGK